MTLKDGGTVTIWANGYSEEDGYFIFTALVDANPGEREYLDIRGITPSNPESVDICIAKFPASSVATIFNA